MRAAIGFNAAMRNLAILVRSFSLPLSLSILFFSFPFWLIITTRFPLSVLTSSVLGRGETASS